MRPGVSSFSEALVAGLLLEGILLAVALFCAWFFGTSFPWRPTPVEIQNGVLLALPLLLFNAALFSAPLQRFPRLREIHEFQNEFILPLARKFDWSCALLISISAGLGEEFFFRGLIQPNLGLVFAALLFALLHFGAAARKFKLTVAIYFLIGLYFGVLYAKTGSIWTAVICHAAYDYAALLYLRYFRDPVTS